MNKLCTQGIANKPANKRGRGSFAALQHYGTAMQRTPLTKHNRNLKILT